MSKPKWFAERRQGDFVGGMKLPEKPSSQGLTHRGENTNSIIALVSTMKSMRPTIGVWLWRTIDRSDN
jgi:hypothetical protein